MVWAGRHGPNDEHYTKLINNLPGDERGVFFLAETAKLRHPDTGNWHHVFDSGVLAVSRLFWDFSTSGDEEQSRGDPEGTRKWALYQFPDLNT
jgi:hypothetical protein